ncbi:hypothetical protein M406DRAFT_355762 [Cryphonectria parasitica EP155]|uniref:Extracellular membrane protein CFEM domain-containing protein n=1 Tax=Cryphonectria parasitica (strain ATCC 38755 / EP155) TaxID=660469 RepID=A0A9P4Y7E2_CRYP1|nr:uncharacterized protein M406DRAFT_355762 [Cryphonectria parasitica EP155]KAF3767918.1 hypothetical protein M406DRAFT_355762 [Cryphonectria parasitica EP155]
MKISTTQKSALATAAALLLANLATAHPHHRIHKLGCRSTDGEQIASMIACGQPEDVRGCLEHVGVDAAVLELCLLEAGCGLEESETEAFWAAERCRGEENTGEEGDDYEEDDEQEGQDAGDQYVVELRELHRRADSTTTTASSTATSTASTSTSSTDTTTSTATSATTTSSSSATSTSATSTSSSASAASTTSSTSASSSTASSTSSSTSSTTSSSASSTSTSSSSSSSDEFPTIGYFVAALLALFVAGCASFICFSCCAERRRRKAAIRRAEAKEALADMHS